MLYLRKIGKSLLYTLISLILFTFFITVLNYYNVINSNIVNYFQIIIYIISLLMGGFMIGRNSDKKGWLEGLKFSLIFLLILIIFNYLSFDVKVDFKNILYYLITIGSVILGSMLGISFKKKNT